MEDASLPYRFDPVGKCIYCGATNPDGGLKIEHIVPQGIGGRFELPAASCVTCEGSTSNIEGVVLRELWHAPRAKLGLLSRKRKKEHPQIWPFEIDFGTHTEPRQVPIAKHPTVLIMPTFAPPAILAGLPCPNQSGPQLWTVWCCTLGTAENGWKVTTRCNRAMFARMLAKIGHAFAVSKLGLDGFSQMLADVVLTKTDHIALDLVGSAPAMVSPPGAALHELGLMDWNGLVVVKIRLFSSLGSPIFYVVAGRPVGSTSQKNLVVGDKLLCHPPEKVPFLFGRNIPG